MRLCGALIFTDLTDKKISGPKHRAPAHSHYENLSIIKTQLLFFVVLLSKHISAYPQEYHHEEYGKKPFEGCDG